MPQKSTETALGYFHLLQCCSLDIALCKCSVWQTLWSESLYKQLYVGHLLIVWSNKFGDSAGGQVHLSIKSMEILLLTSRGSGFGPKLKVNILFPVLFPILISFMSVMPFQFSTDFSFFPPYWPDAMLIEFSGKVVNNVPPSLSVMSAVFKDPESTFKPSAVQVFIAIATLYFSSSCQCWS